MGAACSTGPAVSPSHQQVAAKTSAADGDVVQTATDTERDAAATGRQRRAKASHGGSAQQPNASGLEHATIPGSLATSSKSEVGPPTPQPATLGIALQKRLMRAPAR